MVNYRKQFWLLMSLQHCLLSPSPVALPSFPYCVPCLFFSVYVPRVSCLSRVAFRESNIDEFARKFCSCLLSVSDHQ